eukprot:12441171-Alexandrium_andersonii.AAC.1
MPKPALASASRTCHSSWSPWRRGGWARCGPTPTASCRRSWSTARGRSSSCRPRARPCQSP